MSDVKVWLHCHHCDNEQPSTAGDGQKVRCSNCKTNLTVIRYPELHVRSAIGLNVRAYIDEAPAALVPATRSPVRSAPGRKVLAGSLDGDTVNVHTAIGELAASGARMVTDYRERKAERAAREASPLAAQTPPDSYGRSCEFCADANFKDPRTGRFYIAEIEVTLAPHSVHAITCRIHYKLLEKLGVVIKARAIHHMPSPGPSYNVREIGTQIA
jgi:hypothetical protein